MEHAEFIEHVLRTMIQYEVLDGVRPTAHDEVAPITFLVNCSDFFWWGMGDAEEVTPENVDVFEQAYRDVRAADADKGDDWGNGLFCARVRHLRPQGCCYPKDAPAISALFDACGPTREIDIANPYAHPSDGGQYEYRSSPSELPNTASNIAPNGAPPEEGT